MEKRGRFEETKEDDNHFRRQDHQNDTVLDRLSRLPDNVIGHILSLLPIHDAFMTRRLCRAWFLAWSSDPVLDFNDRQANCADFVERTLSRLNDNVSVQKFKLYQRILGEARDRVDNWLRFVAERNVRELDIDTVTNDIPYTLSQSVLLHANSLTVLRLANMKLKVNGNNNIEFVALTSLKILSLKFVNLDDESARNIISSCSSLEQLELSFCFGLKRLLVSNSNLKALQVKHCRFSRIEVEAKSLHAFSYSGHWVDYFGRLGENGTLANLSILRLWLKSVEDTTSFQARISQLPRLEKLELAWRRGARQVKICNKKLKHLQLDSLLRNVDVDVDAPNLISFEYDKLFISLISLNAPKLQVAA